MVYHITCLTGSKQQMIRLGFWLSTTLRRVKAELLADRASDSVCFGEDQLPILERQIAAVD